MNTSHVVSRDVKTAIFVFIVCERLNPKMRIGDIMYIEENDGFLPAQEHQVVVADSLAAAEERFRALYAHEENEEYVAQVEYSMYTTSIPSSSLSTHVRQRR